MLTSYVRVFVLCYVQRFPCLKYRLSLIIVDIQFLYYIIPTEDTNVSCNLYNVPKPFMIPQIDGHDTMVSQDIIFDI